MIKNFHDWIVRKQQDYDEGETLTPNKLMQEGSRDRYLENSSQRKRTFPSLSCQNGGKNGWTREIQQSSQEEAQRQEKGQQ